MLMILKIIIQLIIAAFIIRYHCESSNIIHFNPLARRLKELTEPIVVPVRDMVKKALLKSTYRPKNDPSTLIVAALLSIFIGIALTRADFSRGFMVGFFWFFLGTWIEVITYSLFLSVIASWLQTPRQQPLLQIAEVCHDFVMRPIRKIVPPFGMLDFTPMFALLGLYLIKNQVLALLAFGA